MESDNIRRPIHHWSAAGLAALSQGQAKDQDKAPQFYWAAFSGILGPDLEAWLAEQGIETFGFAGRPGDLRVYKVRIREGQAERIERLKAVTGFVNILPIAKEEKLSRRLLAARGQARVKATVFFHDNLAFAEAKALLEGLVDAFYPDPDPRLIHVSASPERLRALADLEDVRHVQEEIQKKPVNDVSRDITKVNALQSGILDLTTFPPTPAWNSRVRYSGDSIHVGVNEGIDLAHWDFNERLPDGSLKPRISHEKEGIPADWHGTHVAGIIGGNGWRSELAGGTRYQWRGVAPKVHFSAWGDKGDVNNHSFTNGDEAYYNYGDAAVDDRLSTHLSTQQDLNNVFVWSTANNGGYSAQYGFQRGYFSMLVNAKNPIKVGATDSRSLRTMFSSMGPTRDGRWGPDVVAPGLDIYSTGAGTNDYVHASGTSMSGPHVTGIAALIMQKYRDDILRRLNPDENVHENPMWNSTVKALLVHTATDLVDLVGQSGEWNPDFESAGFPNRSALYTPGPDWGTGFGMVNAQKALQYVDTARCREGVVSAAQTLAYQVTVPSGQAGFRATLAWDDPEYAGIADAANAYAVKLVNDLDIELVSPTGQVFLPWTLSHAPLHNGTVPGDGLDPITPSEIADRPAVRGRDAVNNIEVVDVPNPAPGTWTIRVRGQAITTDQSVQTGLNQDFSLVSDFALPAAPPRPSGPDLIVTRLIHTPSIPGMGRTYGFKAEIKNIGNQATVAGTAIEVELRASNTPVAYAQAHTQSLPAGQSVILDLNVPPPGSATAAWEAIYGGYYAFTAWVDYRNAVAERSDRNNTLTFNMDIPRLPEPWKSQDIGPSWISPGIAYLHLAATPPRAELHAYGMGLQAAHDEFHYLYRPLAGNADITVQVTSFSSNATDGAKTGLMIRETLTQGSRHVFLGLSQNQGTAFMHRPVTDGATQNVGVPNGALGWLRLVRSGSTFTGYRSDDGSTWTQVGTINLPMASSVFIGMAMTSGNPSAYGNSVMNLISLNGGVSSALKGRVTDASYRPLSGVTLTLSGGASATTQTDAQGSYAFTGLANGGNFTVTPSRTGYVFQPASGGVSNLRQDGVLDFIGTASTGLPTPWVHGSVGAEGTGGNATYNTSTSVFTVSGGNGEIGGAADAFRFAHRPQSGDFQVTARVTGMTNTNAAAKAGLMIRENTTAGARHAAVVVTPAGGVSFLRRTAAGGATAATTNTGIVAPVWLRLLKVGSNIKAYRSSDGSAWTLIGETTLSLSGELRAGMAVTSLNASQVCAATFASVAVVPVSSWTGIDVGAVGIAGSFSQSGPVYTVKGAGADVWGAADAFHFVHQAWTGDGQFTARVTAVQNTDPWAKAGIMIRENITAGARNAFMALTPGNGTAFQRRTTAGGSTVASGLAGTAPRWVRLVRVSNAIRGYASADGLAWSLVGETSVAFPNQVLVGLAVTSHNASLLNTSTFESVSLARVPVPALTGSDIGSVGTVGSTAVSGGTVTVRGAGADIWGTDDAFHFAHTAMSGDGEIKARVASLTNTNALAKAGVMIRENTGSGSRHVFMGLTPSSGAEFLRREIGSSTTTAVSVAGTVPSWVRLTRVGNVLTSYVSANGTTWTQVGQVTLWLDPSVRVGLAVCSRNTSGLATGTFDNVSIMD